MEPVAALDHAALGERFAASLHLIAFPGDFTDLVAFTSQALWFMNKVVLGFL